MKTSISTGVLLQLVPAVLVVALAMTLGMSAYHAFQRQEAAERVRSVVSISRNLFRAMQSLRFERGTINTALQTMGPIDNDTRANVEALRKRSRQTLDAALAALARSDVTGVKSALGKVRQGRDDLAQLRIEAEQALRVPKTERPENLSKHWVKSVGALVDSIDKLSDEMSAEISDAPAIIDEMMKIKQLAWVARDAAGVQRLYTGAAIASQADLTADQKRRFAVERGRVDGVWPLIEEDVRRAGMPGKLKAAVAEAEKTYFENLRVVQDKVVADLAQGTAPKFSGQQWMAFSNPGLASLMQVANTAFDLAEAHAIDEAQSAEDDFYIAAAQVVLFALLGALTIFLIVRPLVRRLEEITETTRALASGDLTGDIPFIERGDEIGQLARAVRDAQKELGKKERLSALGQLTATVAHELRNPLSAIRNSLYSMKELANAQGLSLDRQSARMERAVKRCDGIINDLLDFTRSHEISPKPVPLDQFVGDMLSEHQVPKGIGLEVNLAAQGAIVILDRERFQRVLINLIDNAAQAIQGQGDSPGRIIISTKASTVPEIAIEDTGSGIDPKDLPHVFEPLFSTKSFGTGLGLPTVKQIVEQHGGKIVIDSELGRGTTVRIQLPFASVEAQAA